MRSRSMILATFPSFTMILLEGRLLGMRIYGVAGGIFRRDLIDLVGETGQALQVTAPISVQSSSESDKPLRLLQPLSRNKKAGYKSPVFPRQCNLELGKCRSGTK